MELTSGGKVHIPINLGRCAGTVGHVHEDGLWEQQGTQCVWGNGDWSRCLAPILMGQRPLDR